MKKRIYTTAGKTVLFILLNLSAILTAVCILAALMMISESLYTATEKEYLADMRYSAVRTAAVRYAVEELNTNEKAEKPDGLELKITDEEGRAILETEGFRVKDKVSGTSDLYVMEIAAQSLGDDGLMICGAREYFGPDPEFITLQAAVYADPDQPVDLADSMRIRLVRTLFAARIAVYPVGLLFLTAFIVIFIVLICAAGRRSGTEEIVPGPMFQVPFDVLLAAAAFLYFMLCAGLFDLFWGNEEILIIPVAVLTLNLFTALSMSLAVRVKKHSFLKKLLLVRFFLFLAGILKKAFRGIGTLIRNIPLVWRTAAVLLLLAAVEFIVIVGCRWEPDVLLFYWGVEKVILIPVILYIAWSMRKLQKQGKRIADGDLQYQADTGGLILELKQHAEDLNRISGGMALAVERETKSERLKAELITNVSHDIKTPLTSIINYAGLIGNEKTDNKNIRTYSEVLLRQSEKLKRLISDLVEVSKASTGNLEVELVPCDPAVFLTQTEGEYEEKLSDAGLKMVVHLPEEEKKILADGRRMWRIFDNLMNNICKYAQSGTRVYLSLLYSGNEAEIIFRNTSRDALDISPEELTERFVRGDLSRNSEGNGLGLAIAKSMTELQNGTFGLSVDGDLFKVILRFPTV